MPDEKSLRRHDFREGSGLRMADGQAWTFPDPPPDPVGSGEGAYGALADPEAGFGADYAATIAMLLEAEDDAERLRAELALAILLLVRNYDLRPGDFAGVIGFPPGSRALGRFQEQFRVIAGEHVAALRHVDGVPVRMPVRLGA
jgi:hypothetical protein